jgi:hypothetical protein
MHALFFCLQFADTCRNYQRGGDVGEREETAPDF